MKYISSCIVESQPINQQCRMLSFDCKTEHKLLEVFYFNAL